MILKTNKKNMYLLILVAVSITVIAVSFAYFVAQSSSPANTDVNVGTEISEKLIFTAGDAISINASLDNFAEGDGSISDSTTSSATIIASSSAGSATGVYQVYLNITANNFVYTVDANTPELILTVTDPGGNEVTTIDGLSYKTVIDASTGNTITGFDITTFKGLIKIKEDESISTTNSNTGTTENWVIKVTFVNLNSDQVLNEGKILESNFILQEEKIQGDYDVVADLKNDVSLEVGDRKTTKGYYEINDSGASEYEIISPDGIITNEMDYILLDNGLVAKLLYTNKLNVVQLGAKAIKNINNYDINSAFDSSKIFNYGFNLVDDISFPKEKDFIIRDLIYITNSDLKITGNGSNLNTDNNYNQTLTGEKRFVTISYDGEYCYTAYCRDNFDEAMVKNVTWDNLNIISLQTIEIPSVSMQLAIYQASDIVIENSVFRGPGPILTKADDGDFSKLDNHLEEEIYFSNIDLWTAWKNVVLENNEIYLSHDSVLAENVNNEEVFFPGAGAPIQIRDTYSQGSENAIIKNNYIEKVNHDEILSIVSAGETMSDISITDNHFVTYDGVRSSSVIAMSLSLVKSEYASNPGSVFNLNVSNNVFDLQSAFVGINANNLSGNFTFVNNDVNFKRSNSSNPVYDSENESFMKFGDNVSAVSTISNNNIEVVDSDLVYFVVDNSNSETSFSENNISLVNVSLGRFLEGVHSFSNNDVNGTSTIGELTRNVVSFEGNDIVSNEIVNLHRFYNLHMSGTYNYINNNINMTNVNTVDRLIDLQIGGSNLTFDNSSDVVINKNSNNVTANVDGRTFDLKVGFYNVAVPDNLIINYKNNTLPFSYTEVSSIIKDYINY